MKTKACLIAMLCLASCKQSEISADSLVVVHGKYLLSSGAPDAAANVLLIQHPDLLQTAADVVEVVSSLGLACLNQNNTLCHPYASASTLVDGTFTFPTMQGSATQGPTGDALLFTIWLQGPAGAAPATSAAAIQTDFYIQDTNTALPPLTLWQATSSVTAANSNVVFTWTPPSQGVSTLVQITNADGNQLFWQTATNGNTTGTRMDPRVTQDFHGVWGVTAALSQKASNTTFNTTFFAPQVAYPSQGHVPLSRGHACTVQQGDTNTTLSPCPITDGQFATQLVGSNGCAVGDANCSTPGLSAISLDLGASKTLSALMLYDLAVSASGGQLVVESSPDASTWTQQATPSLATYQVVPLNGTARYVRLRLSGATFSSGGNSELAVF